MANNLNGYPFRITSPVSVFQSVLVEKLYWFNPTSAGDILLIQDAVSGNILANLRCEVASQSQGLDWTARPKQWANFQVVTIISGTLFLYAQVIGSNYINNLMFQVTDTTIAATWNTTDYADSNLYASGKPALDNGVVGLSTIHQAIVAGLKPSASYSCFVSSNGIQSDPQMIATTASVTRTAVTSVMFGSSTAKSIQGDDSDSFVSNDNNTYITMDDGYGYDTSANVGANMQMAVLANEATVSGSSVNLLTAYGPFANITGSDGPNGAGCTNKFLGIIGFGGSLYGSFCREGGQFLGHSGIIKSNDHGATWNNWQNLNTFSPSGILPSPQGSSQFPANVGGVMFIRYAADDGTIGYNTAGNGIDGGNAYVYATWMGLHDLVTNGGGTFPLHYNASHLYLMRIPRVDFQNQNTTRIQYWVGPISPTPSDFVSDVNWSLFNADSTPIYSEASKVSWNYPTFIPTLNGYLMINWYSPGGGGPASATDLVWEVLWGTTPAGPFTQVGTFNTSPNGWYLPTVQHRTALSNTLLDNVVLQIIYTGSLTGGHYVPTYSNLTLKTS